MIAGFENATNRSFTIQYFHAGSLYECSKSQIHLPDVCAHSKDPNDHRASDRNQWLAGQQSTLSISGAAIKAMWREERSRAHSLPDKCDNHVEL